MARIELRDLSLEYTDRGTGPPLVLVHGSASDCRTWEAQLPAFEANFRTLTYSRRYHWPNDPAPADAEYDMTGQVADLEAFLQALKLDKVHLVGHSYGAYLCLMLAMKKPSLVDRLVLGEPPVIPLFTSFPPKPHQILALLCTHPGTAAPVIKFMATGLGPAIIAAKKDNMTRAITRFGKAVLGKEAFAALPAERMLQVTVNSSQAELLSDSFMTPISPAEVRRIAHPVLLVTGARSPRMFHKLADHLFRLLPNATQVDIPGASHIMHEDNAPAYNREVLSFLRQ
ncbi:alpha/beta fold hydrolase [Sneathiella sp.]|uniref:alpha/beta fold hydrolase n=1 Tax=Sneathiella sp. TaxID=1964365 RepID=UPI0035623A91